MKNPFQPPSINERVATELDQARRGLLDAQTAYEYAASLIVYQLARVTRLEAHLREQNATKANLD